MSEALRHEVRARLDAEELADPFERFARVFSRAKSADPKDFNAMCLSTVGDDGRPSSRMVLLKEFDARGFVFYTNKQSRKAGELAANTQIALLFYWKSLGRQIRIEGRIEHVTDAEADAYYATRPRVSRLGAWASDQSRPLATRSDLERRLAEYDAKYPGEDIPRPPHWSGYRVLPAYFEFWQNMEFRLHDRTIYEPAAGGGWTTGKLFP